MTVKRKLKFLLVLLSASAATAESVGACRDTEWYCDRALCIPKRWLCDGAPDCSDGTDERPENCPGSSDKAAVRTCRPTEFQCENGNCIPKPWRCDRTDDCRDNSDEVGCDSNCSAGEFKCKSNKQCIANRWRCDGFSDCEDSSDEVNCTAEAATVPPHMFRCDSGINIPRKWVCDGETDCTDGSDEGDCDSVAVNVRNTLNGRLSLCRENEFQCGSYCVMKSWVCDGAPDCPNGEDEANCEKCPPDQFQCADKSQCIPMHQKCNMRKDCIDGSDEDECPTISPEAIAQCNLTTHFMCKKGRCIEQGKLCDGKNNCGDGEDESVELCGVNECDRQNGGCSQKCVNTQNGYYCACDSGYRLVGRYTCEDINECEEVPGICSQTCINTVGKYHCSCFPGYLRHPGNYTRCKAATGEAFLLFSQRYEIRSLRLRDKDMTLIVPDARGATALDYMFSSNQIVWSNNKENEIVRANLNTPEIREVLVRGDSISADGLAVDWIHNHIYYTDTGNFRIHMVTWDAKLSKTIVDEKLGQPRAIVVSPFDGYIFWSDWGNDPKIERAGLDGHDRTPIISTPHVYWPNGITIDHSNKNLFWCDGRLNTISRANLDGSQIEVILYSPKVLRLPYSITVFEDRLYWTDLSQLTMYSANKFNGEDILNISAGHLLESPKVVHVYHEYRQPAGENVCQSHQCSHMCVRSTAGIPLCVCPDGLVLSTTDYRTCLDYDADGASKLSPVPPVETSSQNPALIPTADEPQRFLFDEPQVGMILGVTLGSAVVLLLAIVIFVGWWRSRKAEIKRIRFYNPIYRKTTDEEMDGRGFVIKQKHLPSGPTDYQYSEGPDVPVRDEDKVPLAPKE